MKNFNIQDYKSQLNVFPDITYDEYQKITDEQVRQDIAKRNKILQTDTYNRTMNFIKWPVRSNLIETFTFMMRRAPEWSTYIVVDWIRKMIKSLFSYPITQPELDFAKDFYADQWKKWGVGYFDADMWQKVVDKWWYMPLLIRAVPDGTLVHPGEPVLTVTWPSELAAVFEPMIIRPFFKSAIATTGSLYADAIWWTLSTICEQWKRAWASEETHMDGVSSLIVWWWLDKTSNDAAALVYGLKTAGTTAHRFYSSYPTESEAMEEAAKIDNMVLLSDLIDSKSWIEKILKIKKRKQAEWKNVMPRLDSWDMPELAVYALKRQQELWMTDPKKDKISISDGVSTIEKFNSVCDAVEKAWFDPKFILGFWIWGWLVTNNKTRDAMSAVYKLTNTENWPTWKLSNDRGKETIPGVLDIEIRDWVRYLVQESEPVQWERLFNTVYDNGTIYYWDDDLKEIENARQQVLRSKEWANYETKESDLTHQMHEQVREKLKSQKIEEVESPFVRGFFDSSKCTDDCSCCSYNNGLQGCARSNVPAFDGWDR